LEKKTYYGNFLDNKAGINLEGYFKLYADDKREDMELYRISLKGILSMNQDLN